MNTMGSLSLSGQTIQLFNDLREAKDDEEKDMLLERIHQEGSPQDYTNAVLLCQQLDKGIKPEYKIKKKPPNIDYVCDICGKVLKNPYSKAHINSKIHQKALNKEEEKKEDK